MVLMQSTLEERLQIHLLWTHKDLVHVCDLFGEGVIVYRGIKKEEGEGEVGGGMEKAGVG